MNQHKDQEEYDMFFDIPEPSDELLSHKKKVRKRLEARLEQKRLREEIDELDGEFSWEYLDR